MAKVLTVASGKGGVGKTSISLNLSLALADAGHRVCLFDADLGLANVNILTGLYPDNGLAQVLDGSHSIKDIMIREYNGIDLIPGSSGVEKLADLTSEQAARLIDAFLELSAYDYFILDTSAGISSQVLSFCRASQEMILAVTPEPTSLTDAYSLLKVLSREASMPRIRVVVNQVQTADEAKKAYAKLKKTAWKFLSVKVTPLGIVARDPNVPIAVVSQIPFLKMFPDTQAARCIRSIALKLVKDAGEDMPVEVFWDQCLELLSREHSALSESAAVPEQTVEDKKAKPALSSEAGVPDESKYHQDRQEIEKRLAGIEDKISLMLKEMVELKTLLNKPVERAPKQETPPEVPILATPVAKVESSVTKQPFNKSLQTESVALDFEEWIASR